jgi:hypothetical protein
MVFGYSITGIQFHGVLVPLCGDSELHQRTESLENLGLNRRTKSSEGGTYERFCLVFAIEKQRRFSH